MEPIKFDPNDEEFIRNPYRLYQRLRAEDPVHLAPNGCWVLTRYDDIDRALKNISFSNQPHPFSRIAARNRERFPAASIANNMMAFLDPPHHARIRKGASANFHQQLKSFSPIVSEAVVSHLERLPRNQTFDFLKDYANPVASEVICRFMGFPLERRSELSEWSRNLFYLFHAIPSEAVFNKVTKSLLEFESFVSEQVELKRGSPGDDLLSKLIQIEENSLKEVIHNAMLITADGIGNVDVGMALALHTLLDSPEQFEVLRSQPKLAKSAVAECLRYDSPAQYQGRISLERTTIGSRELPPRSIVLLALASGNRDERVCADADQLDITRKGFRHLSFGRGIHSCLGASLVTLQFESVFEQIAQTQESIVLDSPSICWMARAGHRWPKSLPIKIVR